jgi:hypothetical protein
MAKPAPELVSVPRELLLPEACVGAGKAGTPGRSAARRCSVESDGSGFGQ